MAAKITAYIQGWTGKYASFTTNYQVITHNLKLAMQLLKLKKALLKFTNSNFLFVINFLPPSSNETTLRYLYANIIPW